ncbi:MAG TPA: LacI family DNA-binding transcriptional regulator [Solirubrobacteraceae bacterium]|nr:LacI family DNA-binding transcriptional regulator [Solirubrobacteraceae bacterium]
MAEAIPDAMNPGGVSTSVTLREVAVRAGVHPATVSRALNPQTQQMVSSETLERVLEAARELNYRTNTIARSLRTQRSLTVGVVIPDITNPLFPRMMRGIDDALEEVQYASLVTYTDGRDERLLERFELLRQRGVDGLIVATARHSDAVLDSLERSGIAVVQINRRSRNKDIPSVTADDRAGTRAAVEYLVELGHRHIAHIGGPQRHSTGRTRLAEFRSAMRRAGLGVPEGSAVTGRSVTIQEGFRVGREVLAGHPEVTAILAGNDLMALGCYDALRSAGRRCPQDVSVIGFNDMEFADRFDPPLTTIHFDHYEMGAAAVEILMRRLRSGGPGNQPAARLELDTELIVRASTAPPR